MCLCTVKPPSFHLSFPQRIEHLVQYNVGTLICKILSNCNAVDR